jgi:threonine/homoserine/homoserine lactone efflux protein
LNDFWWLLRGVAIGLAVAIPVGPIAVLCMRRTLERGFAVGFSTGLGAATADLFYSAIAAFGIAAVETALLEYRTPLSFVGGLFLLALAGRTALIKSPTIRDVKLNASTGGMLSALASGFVLTATNPLTVLGFVAIFAGFGVGRGLNDLGRAISLVFGVLAGSALWWMALTGVIARVRHLFSSRTLHRLNLAAAALIAAFGAYELVTGFKLAAPWLF